MKELLRFLEIVRRELGAEDAYVQLGGQPPVGECFVVHEGAPDDARADSPEAWRLVARFSLPPDRADEVRGRLGELVRAFTSTLGAAAPAPGAGVDDQEGGAGAQRARRARLELDGTLRMLADRAGARVALVIDARSPQLWGASVPELRELDLDEALAASRALEEAEQFEVTPLAVGRDDADIASLELERVESLELRTRLTLVGDLLRELVATGCSLDLAVDTLRAIAVVRGLEPIYRRQLADATRPPLLVYPFAGIYRLLLSFDGEVNELRAESVVHRALPVVERMVAGLPPIDPRPKGARIFAFLRPV